MLKKGEVIIFPTDTVYGIGASAFDKEAQDRIYEIKRRPESKRLSVLCASKEDILKIADANEKDINVINTFMPGGLTVILNTKKEVISDSIHETVGVRIPNHKLALEILSENGPMATTSVNYSGFAPLNDYDEIVKEFGSLVDKVYENSEVPTKISSTVIDLTSNPIKLLRAGEISFEEVLKVYNS